LQPLKINGVKYQIKENLNQLVINTTR
jgi:hypothetical protein